MKQNKELNNYKAWILDFDGTLYRQLPLRICMIIMIIKYYIVRPHKISEIFLIRDYRRLREKLFAAHTGDFYKQQLSILAEKYKIPIQNIENLIHLWLVEKPLPFIKMWQRRKFLLLIQHYQKQGVKMFIYSDNPVNEKISALDFKPDYMFFSDDDIIKCMKPNPKGLKNILKEFNLKSSEVLYIGDRDDRDKICAEQANVDYLDVRNFERSYC